MSDRESSKPRPNGDGDLLPVLKGFDCADLDAVEAFAPQTDCVCYHLTLQIGESGDDRADNYAVMVCTPSAMAAAKQAGHRIGSAQPIVLAEYSWQAVVEAIESRLVACRGSAWSDVQGRLRQQFDWEYEGYR